MSLIIKFLQVFLILFASVLMGALMIVLKQSSIVDLVAPGYFVVVNGFLGFDLWIMIKETKKLPGIEFKKLHWYRYIISFFCMGGLAILSIYLRQVHDVQSLIAISSFSLGVFIIIGMILGGLKGNKLVST